MPTDRPANRRPLSRRLLEIAFARLGPGAREHLARLVERRYEEITYRRLADRGFRPGGLIDVGAYRGDWTRMARSIFGQPPGLMVEAQVALIPALKSYAGGQANLACVHALLGRETGREVAFQEMGTGSSMFGEASNAPRTATTLVTRALDEVAGDALAGAADLFLKIDVQGAELEVLRGGRATLERAALVQLEVAMLPYNSGAPLLPEVVAWMAEQGWLPIEVSGFSRPRGQLVQIDLLFAPEDSPLRPCYFEF